MRIIICGAGQVGSSIAKHLASEDNHVTLIDSSKQVIQQLSDTVDVKGLVGSASYPAVLKAAGADEADMVIAVTGYDEVNMVIMQITHSLFNIPTKIARIRSQEYLTPPYDQLFSHQHCPIDFIISPERAVAKAISHRLHAPGAMDMIPFVDGLVKVLSIRCTNASPIIFHHHDQVATLLKEQNASILGLVRQGKYLTFSEQERLLVDDEVYVVVDSNTIDNVMELFGSEAKEARRILIIGGGNIGYFLAQELEKEKRDINIKLIEVNKERADFIAEHLHHSTVINGSALSHEILSEVNAHITETVISVTNDDKVNIMASLLCKEMGSGRAVALINNQVDYGNLVSSLGIDVMVQPREITVSSILQHIRRGKIKSVHTIAGGLAEIIEAEAFETSPMTGKTLEDIALPEGIVIGAIVRDHNIIVPTPDTVIENNDRIIIMSLSHLVKRVEKLFSVKFEYF